MAEALDTDAALMVRVREGDRAAFEQLVQRYQQPVIGFVARMLRDETEAEDIAQHTFVQVWKSAHRYEVSARFATWLFTIARNLCFNEIRRRSRHSADSLDAPLSEDDESSVRQVPDPTSLMASDLLSRGELVQKVDEAIHALPESQRTALMLCRDEEFSYEEIGQVLGTSLSATKSLIFRARETVKARVKQYLKTGEWPT